jgi:hypothetical protein
MLGDTHRPTNCHAVGGDNHLSHLFERRRWDLANSFRELEREWLETLLIFLESVYPLLDKTRLS